MSFINSFVVNTCSIRTKLNYTCSNYTHYVLFQLTYLLRISTIIHCPRCSYWFIKTAITKWEERCCSHCDSSELLPVLCFQIFRNILETEVVSIMEFVCLKSMVLLLQFRISCSICHLFLYSNATEWSQNLYKKINFSTN